MKKMIYVFTVSAPRTSSLWKAPFQNTSKPISFSFSLSSLQHTHKHHHNHLVNHITAHQAIVLTTRTSLASLPPPRSTTGKTAIRVQDSLASRKLHPWEKQIDKTPIMRASPRSNMDMDQSRAKPTCSKRGPGNHAKRGSRVGGRKGISSSGSKTREKTSTFPV